MKEKLLLFIMAIMMIPAVGMAQLPDSKVPAELKKAMLKVKATKNGPAKSAKDKSFKNAFMYSKPLNAQKKVYSPFATATKLLKASKAMQKTNKVQAPYKAAATTVPYGYVSYSQTEGLSTYFCQLPLTGIGATTMGTPCSYVPSAGGSIIDDTYYSFYVDDTYASWFGMYFFYFCGWNTETWELDQTKTCSLDYNEFSNFVTACAKTSDDCFFAETWNSNGDAREFAKFTPDFSEEVVSVTRQTISDVEVPVICMTSASDGTIYAIGSDNALYTIDATTGVETKVGDTGFEAVDAEGSCYGQSICYDNKAGKLYWYAVAADASASPIFEIDTTTGAATRISDDDAPLTQVYGAVVPAPGAEDGAPAAATDLQVVGEGASLTKTVTWTTVSKTYSGEDINTPQGYRLYVNGAEAASGFCQGAGKENSVEITVENGNNTVYVITYNKVGDSPKSNKVSFWAGYDMPAIPEDVTLAIDDKGIATMTWSPVTETMHGGYMGDVTYTIKSGTEVIAENIPTNNHTWAITRGQLKAYKFEVYAVNGTESSAAGESNIVVFGNSLECPQTWGSESTGFSEEDYALFTVVDANEDGSTWEYSSYSSCPFQYGYNSSNDADDWAFTPRVAVKAGKTYIIKYIAASYSDYWPERLEVKVGNAATVDAMTTTAVEAYSPSSSQEEKTFEYTAPADGDMVVGFHAISDADMFDLLLWKVSVEKGPEAEAPAAVTCLKVTPAPKGELKSEVSFYAPTKNIKGEEIDNITKIEVYRDDELIKTVTDYQKGWAIKVNDEVPYDGNYTYKITAYNEYDFGKTATISAYIGKDAPVAVSDAELTDNVTSVDVNWTKVGEKGQNGGYVDPSQVTYSLYTVESGYISDQVFEGTDVDNATITDVNTDEGDPGLLYYAIKASNEMGESGYYGTGSIVVGAPVSTPLIEPFVGGTINNYWWVSRTGNGTWTLSDEYACFMEANAGDASWLSTAKLNIKNLATPGVVFEYKLAAGAKFSIEAMTRDGSTKTLATYESTATPEEAEWTSDFATIPQSLKSEDFVVIRLKAVAETGVGTPDILCVRNFMVRDIIDDDLSVAMATPASVTKGNAIVGTVTVTNEGKNPASNYTVKVTCGNELVAEETVTETLAPYATRIFNFGILASLFDKSDAATFVATVSYDKDLNPDNNSDETEVELVTPTATPVSDLTAEMNGNNVCLTWTAADASTQTVTDGFEDYENEYAFPYTYNAEQVNYFTEWNKVGTMGPWTAYDLDGGAVYGWSSSAINFNLSGDAMGFCVLDCNDVFGYAYDDPSEMVHSGTKALFCMDIAPAGEYDSPECNDDWLVSSVLTGKAQTISFYGREITENYGAETIEVYYSTTDKDVDSFVKLADAEIASTEWEEYSYDLPEGAKYFAIRVTSADIFGAMFDDFTYEGMSDAPTSFNIYRDASMVANTAEKTYTYAETEAGDHTYSVTAVYANGDESMPQSVTVGTGIDELNADGTSKKDIIFRLDGVKVKEANHGVNIINGKTTVVK